MNFKLQILLLLFLCLFFAPFANAEELYPEQDCPSRTSLVIAGAVIGAAVVYELVTPNLNQQNGITFLTSMAVGGISGGFIGGLIAQKSCHSAFAVGPNSIQLCFDY